MPDFSAPDPGLFDTYGTGFAYSPANITPEMSRRAAQLTTPQTYGLGSKIFGSIALGVPNLADNVLSSVPGINAFVKKGDVNQSVLNMIGSPGLNRFYNDNRESIELVSAVAGVIGTEIATRGALRGASTMLTGMKSAPWAAKALAFESSAVRAREAVALTDLSIAASGVLGARQYVTTASSVKNLLGFASASEAAATGVGILNRSRLAGRAVGIGAVRGAARAAISEVALAATMNQNDVLFDDSLSSNLAWASFGVGLGATFGAVGQAWQMRKFVNSDLVRQAFAGALDPTGLERFRHEVPSVAKAMTLDTDKMLMAQGFQDWNTDRATSYALQSRAVRPEGVDPKSFSELNMQAHNEAKLALNRATTKGFPGIGGTGFALDDQRLGAPLKELLLRDGAGTYGTSAFVGISEGGSSLARHEAIGNELVERESKLLKLLETMEANDTAREATEAELRLVQHGQLVHSAPRALVDGEVSTLTHAAAYDNWVEPHVIARDKNDLFEAMNREGGKSTGVGLGADGTIHLKGQANITGLSLANADYFDLLRLYRVGGTMAKSIISRQEGKLVLQSDSPWFLLDLGEHIEKESARAGTANKVDWSRVGGRQQALVESFAQKADIINQLSAKGLDIDDYEKLRVKLNLPRRNAAEQGLIGTDITPADRLLGAGMAGKDIRKMSADELISARKQSAQITDLYDGVETGVDGLLGNSFNFMRGVDGKAQGVVLMYSRPLAEFDWTKQALVESQAISKAAQARALLAGDPFTKQLTAMALNSHDLQNASNVGELMDLQLQATMPFMTGRAPTGTARGIGDAFMTKDHLFRDSVVLQGLTRLISQADRMAQRNATAVIESSMGDVLNRLRGPRNEASMVSLANFVRSASGWDMRKEATKIGEGESARWVYKLRKTPENAARWKLQFGEEMPEGALLRGPDGKDVGTTDLAHEAILRFGQVTEADRAMKNTIRTANGQAPIPYRPFYIPAPDVEGKIVGYTYNSLNQMIPHGTIIADTKQEYDRLFAEMSKPGSGHPMHAEGNRFEDLSTTRMRAETLEERVWQDMTNPGRTPVAGAYQARGKNTSMTVDLGAFDKALATIHERMLGQGREAVQVLLRDPINAVKMRAMATSGESAAKNAKPGERTTRGASVYDHYLREASSGMSYKDSRDFVGGALRWLDAGGGKIVSSGAKAVGVVKESLGPIYSSARAAAHAKLFSYLDNTNFYVPGQSDKETFIRLTKELGPHMPFQDIGDYLFVKQGLKKPASYEQLVSGTGQFSTTWMLRMFEPFQAFMNLAGVLNAAPATIRHLAQRNGESAAEHAARIGHDALVFSSPNGGSYGMLDTSRLIWRAFKKAWSGAADADFARLNAKGMTDQPVSEIWKTFNAIEGHSSFERAMNGDPRAKTWVGKHGLIGASSILTDKSEAFSRLFGTQIGLEYARAIGIKNVDDADNLAHDLANKMIANYRPQNKPTIFQGPTGSMIGLFTSFIQAYYQRMYRYFETGDLASMARQYLTQSTMFGFQSVPGFSELNDMVFEGSEGDHTLYDAAIRKYGDNLGGLLMNGTIGNLPKLFGLQGFDMTSRGGTEFGYPGITREPAVMGVLGKVMQGVGQSIQLLEDENPEISRLQIAEIVSNAIPNRPIGGLIEVALAGDQDTDATGQIVTQNKTFMDSAARILGGRTDTQQAELRAFYANKQVREIQAAKMDVLRRTTRALIREGAQPEDLERVFEQYVKNGGDPRNYRRWIQSQADSAEMTRSQRQLLASLRNPNRISEAQRLLDARVTIGEELSEEGLSAEAEASDEAFTTPDMPMTGGF